MSSLHILLAAGHTAVLAATSSKTTTTAASSSSSALSILPLLLLIGVGGYLLFIRPRSQAMKRQQVQQQQLSIGDRVLTRAGIVGRVRGFTGDRVQLEIASGVVIEVVRQGIGQALPEELDDEDLIPPPPGAEDDDDEFEHEVDPDEDHDWTGEHDDDGDGGADGDAGHDLADAIDAQSRDLQEDIDEQSRLVAGTDDDPADVGDTAPRKRGRGARR